MNVRKLTMLALVCLLMLGLPPAVAAEADFTAAAAMQPCIAGPVYDPACDVDHDGDVDVFDIQLTAGHWNRNGVWTGGDFWSLLGNAATHPAVNFVGTSDNQPLVVRTNNAERMRVAAGGNVGIGTLGPAAPLHVNQGANDGTDVLVTSPEFARMRMVAEAPSVDVTLSLQARGQSTASWAEIGTLSRHDLRFYTNDTYRMALDVNGNVGVGTMGPVARLHVAGSNDGTDVLVTDGEFARMRMEASDPATDVLLSVQARGSAAAQRAEIGTLSNHDVVLYTNGNVLMFLRANGEVCLGSGCP
jgi:hypothetical protein